MAWKFRREGATQESRDLTLDQIIRGLRDGKIETTDEVLGPGETEWMAIENHPELAEIAEEVEPPRPRVHEEATSLDMNPLIDVCLVLLVFFILTTSYATAVMKVIPFATAGAEKKGVKVLTGKMIRERMISVEIGKRADKLQVRVQGQVQDVLAADGTIDGRKFEAALKPFTQQGADRKTDMLLDAHDVDWGTVVRVQDHAKAAGIQNVTHKLN